MADRRFENGALQFDNLKLQFTLDDEGRPTDCFAETRKESNYLVQEFMLQANISAATQIAANLPEQALLRRHESPSERRIDAYVAHAARLGFELDGSSAGALQTSLAAVKGDESKLLLELLAGKGMHKAKYFCSGMIDIAKYSHYALNAPLYTHFTSPIRRYADVVVHRQLLASLDESSTGQPQESRFQMDRDTVAKTAQNCNMKKEGAKLAQEQSAHLFLCVLLHDLTERYGSVIREASVVNVLDEAFDVVVSEFGIEKRVHADQMPLDVS
jgi:protein SSD1